MSVTACTAHACSRCGFASSTTGEPIPETADAITCRNNPVDIHSLVKSDLAKGRFADAALAFVVAQVFVAYDINRVADPTAHQAADLLAANLFVGVPEPEVAQMQEAWRKIDFANVRSLMERIGKPTYAPTWMIQHGVGALRGGGANGGIVEGFNEDATWKSLMEQITAAK